MTNKFYKVLGICLLAIMVPVMVATTIVALTVKKNGDRNTVDPTPNPTPDTTTSYSVTTDYGTKASKISFDETSGKWTINEIPTRNYYTFSGLKVQVNGVNEYFEVNDDKEIVLTDANKAAFGKAVVEDGATVYATWDFNYTNIRVVISTNWIGYLNEGGSQSYVLNLNELQEIESIGLLTRAGYDFEEEAITDLKLKISNEDFEINDADATDWSTFTEYNIGYNVVESGDIKLDKVLDKLAESGASLDANSNGLIKIFVA